ncbi:MAG: glycerol-3-phosphate 1-O-acyltransferase PlsY [Cyanobacteria bacterium Co-bin13]|nr:glycerol-3-phosphate 1-O-acyltransferase PlsY [Cyanobacteria bacterium Co-bin13]
MVGIGVAIAGLILAAYLLGSIPTGYLIAKWAKGIDIREYGSGGTGATNVLRTVGKPAAAAVLLVDLVKGALAVLLVKLLYPTILSTAAAARPDWQPWIEALAALAALLGHSRSIWLNFTGGKSAASGLGILLAMSWPVGLGTLAVFAAVVGVSRIVSLGSIAAAIATILLMVLMQQPVPYIVIAIAGGLYVILRHRSNIERLLAGTEPRLGSRRSESSES